MSNHTKMPPALSEPWCFGGWDNRKSSTPPYEHRHFWYWDGTGDKLVIGWRYGFDDGGYEIVCGDIHRCTTMLEALRLWESLKCQVGSSRDWKRYCGIFIFYGTRRVCRPSIYGEEFPDPLPDGRWT